jgi:phosphoglucomutase
MARQISPLAGTPAPASALVDVPRLIAAYCAGVPDASVPGQRVAFGTSGHRGSSFELSFNEWHVLAIAQSICDYRRQNAIDGPLFLGADTHALSQPACASALEVLAANGVDVVLAAGDEFTPTPVISHAILTHNRRRTTGFADGIVVTPSHNPPEYGGIKYNTPDGGPAGEGVTDDIGARANGYMDSALRGVRRVTYAEALRAPTTRRRDFLDAYVAELGDVVDMAAIRDSGIRIGVDPLGGAGVHYWPRIAEHYRLDLTVVNDAVDPTFRFMSLDWDGRIRMDPSSPFAMRRLLDVRDRFDVAFACDTDHDRHAIVTGTAGLLAPNHYLSVAIDYLFRQRPLWSGKASIGKTVVSTRLIDRVAARLGRGLYEVPVGFKWFVGGLLDASLGFAGEESAGATFLRRDGSVWTTDKDGIVPALLAAEITARRGRDPGALYAELARELGEPVADRVEAPATPQQKLRLAALSPAAIAATELAGETIEAISSTAPGNGMPIGGIRAVTASGWFAARPSGTESIYKIYAESFRGPEHLQRILAEAQAIVDRAIAEPS